MKNLISIICILILLIMILYPNEKNTIYIPNFLSDKDLNIVKNNLDYKNFKNEKFRNIKPIYNKNIYDIFYSPFYLNKINKIINKKLFKSSFPIEHRIYPKGSKGMKWHIDTLLYDKPQYEAVFTVNNNSDSLTEWIDGNNKISRWTEPNSLLLVKAQGDYHHVTPIKKGNREILKLIYSQSNKTNKHYSKELERFKFFKS